MRIANGEIRAWESIKMTFSTYREKSGLRSANKYSHQPTYRKHGNRFIEIKWNEFREFNE